MKPPLRTKSVGTKVSDAEYAALEGRARASGLTLSEWVRDVLLGTGRPGSDGAEVEQTAILLGEVLALRTILLNLLFSLTNGKPVTPEAMRELIERADGDKERRAAERLWAPERLTAARATVAEPESEAETASETNPEEG